MSNNNRIANKLTNGKSSYFVTNTETSEPKEDVEKQTNTSKPTSTDNPDKSTKTVHDDCYEYPKKLAKTSKLKDQCHTSIETTSRFSILSPDEIPTDSMGRDSSLNGACERSIQIDDSNSNNRTTSYKKSKKK